MTRKLTTEEFIARAKKVHGNVWCYKATVYKGQLHHVQIGCQVHGPYFQLPDAHVRQGQGCPVCGRTKSDAARVKDQEYFLSRVSSKFKETYDVTRARYAGIYKPVDVVCREHGPFSVKPCDIYKNVGCPECSTSGFKIGQPAYLYILENEKGVVKVGITNRTPQVRARKISSSSGLKHRVVYFVRFEKGKLALEAETRLLNSLRTVYESPTEVYDGYTESFLGVEVHKLVEELTLLTGAVK